MVEINLLPAGQRKKASAGSQPWQMGAIALGLLTLATIAGLELYYGSQVSRLHKESEALDGEIAALEPYKRKYDELQTEKADLEKVAAVSRALRDQKTYWSNDLAAFTAQIPGGNNISLQGIDMHPMPAEAGAAMTQGGLEAGVSGAGREIVVNGTASSQQAVIDFLNAFENDPNFGIVFQNMQKVDTEGAKTDYTFAANVGVINQLDLERAKNAAATGTTPAPAGTDPAAAPAPAPAAPAAPAPAAPTPAGGN